MKRTLVAISHMMGLGSSHDGLRRRARSIMKKTFLALVLVAALVGSPGCSDCTNEVINITVDILNQNDPERERFFSLQDDGWECGILGGPSTGPTYRCTKCVPKGDIAGPD